MTAWPAEENREPVSTTVRPVTQTADVAVKRASTRETGAPGVSERERQQDRPGRDDGGEAAGENHRRGEAVKEAQRIGPTSVEGPEAEHRPAVDVLLRHLAPAAAVVAAAAVVPEHEVVALADLRRREAVDVPEALGQVRLARRHAVHHEPPRPDLDQVSGKPHHALDEGHRGVTGVPEHHHVPSLDRMEAVDELVDHDPLAVEEKGFHARALHPESLGDESDQEEAEEDGDREVVEELPHRTQDAPAGGPEGDGPRRRGLAPRRRERHRGPRRLFPGAELPGLEGHRFTPLTTRVPAIRSCSPLPPNATIRKPMPRLAAESR